MPSVIIYGPMVVSSLVYFIGVLGGVFGLFATVRDAFIVAPRVGLAILLVSIALLWVGVLLESIEETYFVAQT